MLTLQEYIKLDNLMEKSEVDIDIKKYREKRRYEANKVLSALGSGVFLGWLMKVVEDKSQIATPTAALAFMAALGAAVHGTNAIRHYIKERLKSENEDKIHRRVEAALDTVSKLDPKQRQQFNDYLWKRIHNEKIKNDPNIQKDMDLERKLSALGPEASDIKFYWYTKSPKLTDRLDKLYKHDPKIYKKVIEVLQVHAKNDSEKALLTLHYMKYIKSGNIKEDIANSVGGGGVAGILKGEDPPVRKKKTFDGDKLYNPDDVENDGENDEIKESFKYPSFTEYLSEMAAPGTEEWILNNKARFVAQYGRDEGLKRLYGHAWNISKKYDKRVPKDFGKHKKGK